MKLFIKRTLVVSSISFVQLAVANMVTDYKCTLGYGTKQVQMMVSSAGYFEASIEELKVNIAESRPDIGEVFTQTQDFHLSGSLALSKDRPTSLSASNGSRRVVVSCHPR